MNAENAIFRDVENKIRETTRTYIETALRERNKITIWNLFEQAGPSTPRLEEILENEIDSIVNAFINGEIIKVKSRFCLPTTQAVPDSISNDQGLSEIYSQVKKILEKEVRKGTRDNAYMGEDIYGGVTNNRIEPKYGHGFVAGAVPEEEYVTYWYGRDGSKHWNQLFESWAEFFSAKIRNDEENINRNAELFPLAAGARGIQENGIESGALDILAEELYNHYYTVLKARYGV